MASKHILEILLQVNGKSAKGEIKSVVDAFKKEFNKNFTISVDFPNSKSVSNRLGRMTRRLETFNRELERLGRLAPAASAGIAQVAASTGVATDEFKNLRVSSSQANKVLQGTASVVGQGATAMERLGAQTALTTRRYAGFVVASRFLFGFERSLEEAISGAVSFNTQLVKIAQVTKLPIAAIQSIKSEIRDLSVEFAAPADELLQAAVTLSQAGFSFRDTRAVLADVAPTNLAPTFGEISDTVDGLIAILNQFNIEARKTGDVLDILNSLAAEFPAEVGDLFEIVKRSGAAFSAASGVKEGVKDSVEAFKELAAIGTAVRSTTRLNATQIGTSLRTIFSRIQKPEIIEDLRQLGIELRDVKGNFIGPIDALTQIDEKLKGVSTRSSTFQRIVQDLGGIRQSDKTIALLTNLPKVLEALDVAGQSGGSVADDATKALEDLGNQLKSLGQNFNRLVGEIVSSGSFQRLIKTFVGFGNVIIDAAKILKPVAPALAGLVGLKGLIGFGHFIKGFRDNIRYVNANTQALQRNSQAILGLSSRLGLNQTASLAAAAGRIPRRATGGIVRGPGGSKQDNILTAISNGEYVINAEAVKKVGLPFLNAVNAGSIPKFADGGFLGGGASGGKFDDLLKKAIDDSIKGKLVREARSGAEAFKLNPQAIENIILSNLEKGIDPAKIRANMADMFHSIRNFIDSRISEAEIPSGKNVPSNLIVPQEKSNVKPIPPLVPPNQQLAQFSGALPALIAGALRPSQKNPPKGLPYYPGVNSPIPNFSPIRPDLHSPTNLISQTGQQKPLLNLTELGLDYASREIIDNVVEYNKQLLLSGEAQDSIVRRLKALRAASSDYSDFLGKLRNDFNRNPKFNTPLAGGGVTAGELSPLLLTALANPERKNNLPIGNRNLPIVNPNFPVGNPQIIDSGPARLPGPNRLLGLPAPTPLDEVRDILRRRKEKQLSKAQARREYERMINNPPILLGDAPVQYGPTAPFSGNTTEGPSSFKSAKDRFLKRGFSDSAATEAALLSGNRGKAAQRLPGRLKQARRNAINKIKQISGPKNEALQSKIGGGALAASLLVGSIPTKQGGFGQAIQKAIGGAATGAFLGSAVPGIGTAVGAGVGGGLGALAGIVSGIQEINSTSFTDHIDKLTAALDDRRINENQKADIFSRIFERNLIEVNSTFFEGRRKSRAQELFANTEGTLDDFSNFLAGKAVKSGAKSFQEFLAGLDSSSNDLKAYNEAIEFATKAGRQFDPSKIADEAIQRKLESRIQSLSTTISDVVSTVLVRELDTLSTSIAVASATIDSFSDNTKLAVKRGLGDFSAQFEQISLGAGTFPEVLKAFPQIDQTVPGALLSARNLVNNQLNGQLLGRAFGDPSKFADTITSITKDVRIPATLRNELKAQTEEVLKGLDDATPQEKFEALSKVLTDFSNHPAFEAAQRSVENYVALVNKQNAAIADNINSYLQLANASRQANLQAFDIGSGGQDFRRRFSTRFEDLTAGIGRARSRNSQQFGILFPNVQQNSAVQIGRDLAAERARLDQLNVDPTGNATAIRQSTDKITQLTEALKFTRDSVDELTAIENRLVEINQNRQNAVDFARQIATADPAARAEINRSIGNIRRFEAGGQLTAQQTASALDFLEALSKLDDSVLKQFGRSREDIAGLREAIIGNRLGRVATGAGPILGAFANAPGQGREEAGLLNRADAINKNRADAALQLGKLAQDRITEINELLNRQLKTFADQQNLLTQQTNNLNKLETISERFAAIPKEIELKSNINVNVNLNNGQILNELDPFIKKVVTQQINEALRIRDKEAGDIINGN